MTLNSCQAISTVAHADTDLMTYSFSECKCSTRAIGYT